MCAENPHDGPYEYHRGSCGTNIRFLLISKWCCGFGGDLCLIILYMHNIISE